MRSRLFLWGGTAAIVLSTAVWIWCTSGDWGTWLLTVAVLMVAAWTLDATVLRPPRIWISKPDELDYTDLIFYLYDHEGERIPRDYLLQLHVLLGNTGGKKGIVTSVKMTGLQDAQGAPMHLPELPKTLGGQHYSTWTSWRDIGSTFDRREVPPPFMLAANEVMVLRFRGRRGIDWSDRWTLEKLREYHEALSKEPHKATIEVVYRWGKHKKSMTAAVPLKVGQHQEYVNQITSLTEDFRERPSLPERRVHLESKRRPISALPNLWYCRAR